MMWYGDMGGWGYLLMTISSLAFVALAVAGIVVLVRYAGRAATPAERITPEQVLRERFARGEIDADEYRQRLETMRPDARTQH